MCLQSVQKRLTGRSRNIWSWLIYISLSYNCQFSTVFHGFGGRWTVADVGPTTINKIMDLSFKEIGLKKRDLNGQTQFGEYSSAVVRTETRGSSVIVRTGTRGWLLSCFLHSSTSETQPLICLSLKQTRTIL